MIDTVEVIMVRGVEISVDKLCTRRWRQYLPGYVERVYSLNPGIAAFGPFLPVGTKVRLPPPSTQEKQSAVKVVRLWD
jgi:phage tail protein X